MSVIYDHNIRYKIGDNGVMETEYIKRQFIDLKRARAIRDFRVGLQDGKHVRLLMTVRKGTVPMMTLPAMMYLLSKEGTELISAIALYFEDSSFLTAHKFITRWLTRERIVPHALFTTKDDALTWLLDQDAPPATLLDPRAELSLSQRYNVLFLDLIPGMVFIVSPENYVVWANAEARQRLGMKQENLQGRPFSSIRFPDDVVMECRALPAGIDGRQETLWIARTS